MTKTTSKNGRIESKRKKISKLFETLHRYWYKNNNTIPSIIEIETDLDNKNLTAEDVKNLIYSFGNIEKELSGIEISTTSPKDFSKIFVDKVRGYINLIAVSKDRYQNFKKIAPLHISSKINNFSEYVDFFSCIKFLNFYYDKTEGQKRSLAELINYVYLINFFKNQHLRPSPKNIISFVNQFENYLWELFSDNNKYPLDAIDIHKTRFNKLSNEQLFDIGMLLLKRKKWIQDTIANKSKQAEIVILNQKMKRLVDLLISDSYFYNNNQIIDDTIIPYFEDTQKDVLLLFNGMWHAIANTGEYIYVNTFYDLPIYKGELSAKNILDVDFYRVFQVSKNKKHEWVELLDQHDFMYEWDNSNEKQSMTVDDWPEYQKLIGRLPSLNVLFSLYLENNANSDNILALELLKEKLAKESSSISLQISALQSVEQILNEQFSVFAGSMTHGLKNRLGTIYDTFNDIMGTIKKSPIDKKELSEYCIRGKEYSKKLHENCNAFFKYHTDKQKPTPKRINIKEDLNNIFNETKDSFSRLDKNIKLQWSKNLDINPDTIEELIGGINKSNLELEINTKYKHFKANSLLERAIHNLFDNSFKHGYINILKTNIKIRIVVQYWDENEFEFYYSDNGEGILRGTKNISDWNEEFWKPFQTIGNMGITFGSYEIWDIIRMHGGHIELIDPKEKVYKEYNLYKGFAVKFTIKGN